MNDILLVEDEEHLARGLKFNLEAEGYHIQVAGDGESALDLLLKRAQGLRPGRARRHAARQGRLHRRHRAAQGQQLHSAV